MQNISFVVLYFLFGLSTALTNLTDFLLVQLPSILNPKPNCTEKYGDQPTNTTYSLQSLFDLGNICLQIPGPGTNLVQEAKTANLTVTKDGPSGYHLLLPFARNITNIYPFPANQALGWDNWYRNYNRSDPALNVDVQTIDYFIDQVVNNRSDNFSVDKSCVFMSGWSNGAAMATQYGLNTPGIAAVAAYSAPDPYRDYEDSFAQTPYPTYFTPTRIVYNQCDIVNICVTGTGFIQDLNKRYPTLIAESIILNDLFIEVDTCNPLCTIQTGLGVLEHGRWPVSRNNLFFNFLQQYRTTI